MKSIIMIIIIIIIIIKRLEYNRGWSAEGEREGTRGEVYQNRLSCWKRRGKLRKYHRGGELVQSKLHTSMELSLCTTNVD
jgi:hypothetical protein